MANPDEELKKMIANMPEKTGKSLDQWVAIAKKSGETKHGQIVAHLKAQGLGHGFANVVAHTHLKSGSISAERTDDLVDAQYAGAKAPMRAWYDALAKKVGAFGSDVELSPKKAYVSLRRSKQFGLIQPSTATRMDVGIVLKGVPAKGRLEAAGSWNTMVTHRVKVESAAGIDAELVGWLKAAYDTA